MTPEEAAREEIDSELRRAAEALAAGNDGKARVCARRACGVALRAWYRRAGRGGMPPDAQSLLKVASADPAIPAAAREAAARLSAPVAGDAARVTSDPIADAHTIIEALAPAGGTPGA